jgi:hypothetical protein
MSAVAGGAASLAEAGPDIASPDARTIPTNATYFIVVSFRSHDRDMTQYPERKIVPFGQRPAVTSDPTAAFLRKVCINCLLFPLTALGELFPLISPGLISPGTIRASACFVVDQNQWRIL